MAKDRPTQRRRGARLTGKSLGRPEGASGEETRERLLEVAATLFAREGYRGVSLAEIAGAAGISAPAIYNHFGSKDDLFIETATNIFEEIKDAVAQSAAAPGTWHDKLARVLATCEELYREDAVLQRFGSVFDVQAARDPEKYVPVRQVQRELDGVFRDIVQHAVNTGGLPASVDVNVMGDLLTSLIMGGIASRTLTSPSKSDHQNLVAAFKTLLGIDEEAGQATVTHFPNRSA